MDRVNTMRRTLFALALVATTSLACGKADTVLRVTLDPVDTSASPVTWLASQVAIGDESRTMDINSPNFLFRKIPLQRHWMIILNFLRKKVMRLKPEICWQRSILKYMFLRMTRAQLR